MFHHIPDWEKTIKEISRVLTPGGYFNWIDLTIPKLVRNIFNPFVKKYGLYTIDDFERYIEINGFRMIINEKLHHGPLRQYHYLLRSS